MNGCPPAPADERGFTLVEVIIALFLLGSGVAGVLTALQVGVGWSAQQRDLATAEQVLRDLAEHVKAAEFACGADHTTGFAAPAGVSVQQVGTRHWDGSVTAPAYDATPCAGSDIEVVALEVDLDGLPTRSTEVVKRRLPG